MTPQDAADHAAIINLEALYAKTWDQADAEGWAGVFTEEGRFEIAPVGDRQALLIMGRAALARFCAAFNSDCAGVHLPSLPWIRLEGDRAFGHVNFHFVAIARHGPVHTVSRTATGHYEVAYCRTPDGWRMEHRLEKPLVSARSEFFSY